MKVFCPQICETEIRYTLAQVLGNFLGLKYSLITEARDDILIQVNDSSLTLDISFFKQANEAWLEKIHMPKKASEYFVKQEVAERINEKSILVLFGKPEIFESQKASHVHFDLFGTIFFFISRYEEYFPYESDIHNRFTFKNSVFKRLVDVERPIVNEYVAILSYLLENLNSEIKLVQKKYSISVSADLDNPYLPSSKSFRRLMKRLVGDVIVRKQPLKMFNTLFSFFEAKLGLFRHDRYIKALDYIMTVNEQLGNKVSFNVISDNSGSAYNGVYDLSEPVIMDLLKSVIDRGHKVGLHGSYFSYTDEKRIAKELGKLTDLLTDLGYRDAQKLSSRQHYLRWNVAKTNPILARSGIIEETSLGFNDHIGFRAGTCFQYMWYDCMNREETNILVTPLIVMDCAAVESMGLGFTEDCARKIFKVQKKCEHFNGVFSFLWHNSYFEHPKAKFLYEEVIKHASPKD